MSPLMKSMFKSKQMPKKGGDKKADFQLVPEKIKSK